MRFLIFRPVSRARCARAGIWEEAMSKWQLFWAMVALATAPLFAETTFRYSTLDRVGELAVRPTSETTGLSFTLSDETFDKAIGLDGPGRPAGETVTEWRPVAFVPSTVTVTEIAVAIPGTEAPASLTVTPAGVTFTLTKDAESVTLTDTDGSTATATLRTYKNTDGVTLDPGKPCAFRFADSQTGTAISNFYTFGDKVPHLRVTGTASITRHVLTIKDGEEHGYGALLHEQAPTYSDAADHVVIVEFSGEGGRLNMDSGMNNSPLVIGSSVSLTEASTKAAVSFDSDFAVPLSLRDGEGGKGGVSLTFGTNASFNPSALLLACDVTLKSPVYLPEDLPEEEEAWLATHDVPIPAGRTFRLELDQPVDSEDNLPNLSFADATSRLELASDAASPEKNPLGIPSKYQTMLCTQSGTLVLDRNVSANSFTISDLRAYHRLSANRPLETHVILRGGHRYDFTMLGFVDGGAEIGSAPIGKATLTVEGGTLTASTLNLTAADAALDVRGGAVTANRLAGIEAGTRTAVSVAQGASLTLNAELTAGEAGNDGVFDLTVAGTLNLGGNLNMVPALRRTLRLEDGTIHATSAVKIKCTDSDTPTAEDYLTVSGGGTFSGPLTVDSVTGNGLLMLGEGATVSTLYAYNGTIEGTGMIGAFTGDLGDVTLGGDWLTGPGKSLAEVVDKAQNYHGTLGFTAGTAEKPKTIDFAAVAELTELPGAFRVAEYQDVTMRLDQYIDATVRWPADTQDVTLTLIESGAYGGEAEIPVVPAGVTFAFQYYDAAGQLQPRPPMDYQREPSEDGVSDELTWENAVFTGQGAWIDVEFDGDTRNAGWFGLGEKDGCLVGLPSGPNYEDLTTDEHCFTPMGHPVSKGMTLGYRPYVAESALPSFPEEWSLAVRMTAPSLANKCILAIGNNYANATASTYSLVFATGAVESDGTTEIVLWKFDGYADGANNKDLPAKAIRELFRVKVADAQRAPHVFSVVCDGATLNLYMDGAWLNAINVPAQTTLSGGLQLGQQLGGIHVSASARSRADDVNVADGGAVDYIRFYKGAFPEAAMVEMADRTPYVRENLRYVRYVPAATIPKGGETWIQDGAWMEQTYVDGAWVDGKTVDQPAEGAECRILVAAGEHPLQVNVERQVEAKAKDGTVTNEGRYFYSPNRTYASLVVRAQDAAASAATLRLVPLGVTEKETADTETDTTRPWESQLTRSAWFTTTEASSPGNRTGFRYGKLRFTGGAGDPINDDPAITGFHGAGYLLPCMTTTSTQTEWSDPTYDANIAPYNPIQKAKRTLTETATDIPVHAIYDAGICYLSKYAKVELLPAQSGTRTWTEEIYRQLEGDTDNPTPGETHIFSSTEPEGTFSEVGVVNTLTMVAGMSLTRGMVDEVARWQLTGPVALRGTATLKDHVLGHSGVPEDQASEDVWVPFFGADSTWKFYDDTRVEGVEGGTDNANDVKNNANGVKSGLFARGVRATGRLYLDFTAANGQAKYKADTNFSKQAWYRYNYEGETAEGPTGNTAKEANADDFAQAVAFQIRLSSKADKIVTLTLDKVPDADVQTFYVEEDEEAEGTTDAPLTLVLETPNGGKPLTVWQRVVAAARLDVSNHGKGNALNLRPEGPTSARRTPIHRGNSTRGAYVVGNAKGDWDFGAESSVPRLEVATGCELTFTVGQDLRRYGTVVAAQKDAYIHHTSNEPFLGQDIELAEGATFGFHAEATEGSGREEGVVLAGRLVLRGNATLRAEGGSGNRLPRFYAAGGIVAEPLEAAGEDGQAGGVALTVHADEGAAWRSRTAALTGEHFGLRKTGPGVVTFDTDVPPSVSGKVTVEAGTLNVTAAADTPVGKQGLHVAKDATLGNSGRMVGEGRLLAAIPAGQELSGGGTVDGALGLQPGATYVATQGEHLTVAGGLAVGDGSAADINVTLPTGTTEGGTTEGGAAYVGDTHYLVSGVEERTIRRRFKPTLGGARWDAIAWLQVQGGKTYTYYAARKPAMPVPGDFKGDQATNAWHDGFEKIMVKQYQSLGHAYVGATQGRTRAGSARLSASQINDALYAFSGISAFHAADEAATGGRTYIDAHNFYVAYEFGISRMAFATIDGEKHVVVEVKVQNALADTFPTVFARDAAIEAIDESAAFRSGTKITFQAVKDGKAEPLPATVSVKKVANLAGKPLDGSAPIAADTRYFAMPYEALKEHFDDAPILLRPSASNEVDLPGSSEAL